MMACCKTSVRFDINFTFSTEHRLTFTILVIAVVAAAAAVVFVVVVVAVVDVAALLLDQSIKYICSKEHNYTHDTAQGSNDDTAGKTEKRHEKESWK